jgi:cytochrome c oxidase subunit 2
MSYKVFMWIFTILSFIPQANGNQPVPWQMGFQSAASPVMEKIVDFHHILLIIIFSVGIFVTLLLGYIVYRFRSKRQPVALKTSHNTLLEVIWTAVPVVILAAIAVPSMKLLYFMDKTEKPEMTLKVTGHQWYWSYDYPEEKISFDSYMIKKGDLKDDQVRLLDVDHPVVLPTNTNIRILVTSADVLHSWAMPAFGIKQDTIPGRLRETWVRIQKPGRYYGQCSEICGIGHGFMSIAVDALSPEDYKKWLITAKQKFS